MKEEKKVSNEIEDFNFEIYKQNVTSEYIKLRPIYEAFSTALKSILERCINENKIKFHSIEARTKTIESFGEKAIKPLEDNPNRPKYDNPLKQITDLSGVRIITFFPSTVNIVDKLLYEEFDVLEKSNKSDILEQEEKLGYQSVHYLVKLKDSRSALSEYKRFKALIAEIQVRTILQHAWAEIEHDIEYKSAITIPSTIKRRFMALAGLLEIADREFQSIQNKDAELRSAARVSLLSGKLETVEITPDALKAYLDNKIGPDGRMSEFSYNYEASILIKMGFMNFKQIDAFISGYDDDKISRVLWGARQGQLTRFELTLLASMGVNFIKRHPWSSSGNGYWVTSWSSKIEELKKANIKIGNNDL